MTKLPIGIDISKDTLDYHVHQAKQEMGSGRIGNQLNEIRSFLCQFCPNTHFLVAEPTGTYGDKLFELATQLGFDILLAPPWKSSQFTSVLGIISKTDRVAAYVLAQMGLKLNLDKYHPQSAVMKERKQVQMAINALSKQCQMLKNQLHALEQRFAPSQAAVSALSNSLATLEQEKQRLEEQLQDLDEEEAAEFRKYAQSVKGIGPKSAAMLMLYTNGMKYFDKKTQLPRFIGTAPTKHYSGTSIKVRGAITKSGPPELRACLYNAAKSAKRFNHACKALYERLRKKGKPHKVAMIAVINKLLHQVFAVVKSKNLFDNELYLKNYNE